MRYLPLMMLLLLLGLFYWGLGHDPHHIPSELIGKPAPTFNANSLVDNQALNQKVLKGQPTILNVWATWCLACHSEHSFLFDIIKQKVRVIGLNYKDERLIARQWLEQQGNPYQKVLFDPEGKIANLFGVYGTPETFLIDSEGIIRHRHTGALTSQIWKREFIPLIQKMKGKV